MKYFFVIGLAGFVAARHLKVISELGGELVAGCDLSDSVGVVDSFFPNSQFFTHDREYFEFMGKWRECHPDSECYSVICSPNYLHYQHISNSLENGIDVICEKPSVLTEADLNKLLAKQAELGCSVYTILQLRLSENVKKTLPLLKSEKNEDHIARVRYVTPRGKWYEKSWKSEPRKSGGLTANIGVHLFDLACVFFGRPLHFKIGHREWDSISGSLRCIGGKLDFFLSINPKHSDGDFKAIREFVVDDQKIDFSTDFLKLHEKSYREIFDGNGFTLEQVRFSTKIIEAMEKHDEYEFG